MDTHVELDSALMTALDFATHTFDTFSENVVGRNTLRLGGGTALAALWNHRYSTDLDLVVNRDVYDEGMTYEHRRAMTTHLKMLRDQGVPLTKIGFRPNMVYFRYQNVPVSLVPSRLHMQDTTPSDYQCANGVRLAKPEMILRGKLVGRLLTNKLVTDRDGYDVAYALTYHPDVVDSALVVLEKGERKELVHLMADAVGQTGHGRAIYLPIDQEMAKDPWKTAHALILKRDSSAHSSPLLR